MKKFLFVLALILVFALPCFAGEDDPFPPPPTGKNPSFDSVRLRQYTVATLPATPTTGDRAEIIDGASTTDCTVGGGTDIVTCRWNGSAWANVGDGQAAGSAEVQDEAYSAANFNGDVTHAPTQNVFYDFWHLIDLDDDGVITDSELSIAGLTLTGANGLTLGAAGSVQGLLRLYSNVPDNTYRFDLFGGAAFTENVGWRAPVAMPTVLNALVNVDVTTGQIDYTDPATFLTAAGTDNVKDTHIDWGDGAGQIGYADIVGTFGGGACSGYLKSDGTCDTPSGAAHDAVTLSTDLGNNLLGLSTQQITLDNQTANYIFAGPTTGGAAAPAFRAMVDADIPSAIARDTELHAAVTLGASLSSIFSLTGQELGLTAWPTFNQNTTGTAGGLSGTPNITVGTVSAGAGGFTVDADGDTVVKTITTAATAAPGYTPYDSDSPGTDKTAGFIGWQYVDGADGAENSDFLLQIMQGGTLTTVLAFDESDDQFETSKAINSSGGFVGALTGNASTATAAATQAITDNAILTVDHASAADDDFAKFTAAGIEGRSYAETRQDLGIDSAANFETTLSLGAFASDLLGYADASAVRTGLSLVPGTDVVPVGSASGGLIFGDSTPDAEGEIGYASNQASVHDGTASRSLLQIASTVITKSEYLPIRYAEDDDSVTAPAAAAEVGTTTAIARSFVEDADNGVVFWWNVPMDYSAGIKYRVYYAIQTDADADETVSFALSGCSNGNTDALACTEGTAVNVADELTTDYDANELIVSDWSSAVTVTNIAAGEMAKLLFIRDVSEDDYAGASDNVLVIGVEVKYQAKVNASGDY